MNRVERNEMVTQHLPLVGYLVSDLCSKASHLSRDDLASAGAIALITSADSFDPDLGVPFAYTWSCYLGGRRHCGRCGTCVERKEAFALARVTDPTDYDDPSPVTPCM